MRAKFSLVVFMVVIAVLAIQPGAYSAQKPEPSQVDTKSAEANERIKQLEAEMESLKAKYEQAEGFSDTEYILRIQANFEKYYEKAFNTQMFIITAIGLFLTAIGFFAGRIGFRVFDRQIEYTIKGVTTELRSSFESRLRDELELLEKKNDEATQESIKRATERIDEAINKMDIESQGFNSHNQALAFVAMENYEKASSSFMDVIELYVQHKDKMVISESRGATAIANFFRSILNSDTENFEKNAETKLGLDIFKDLKDELMKATELFPRLKPLVEGSDTSNSEGE